MWQIYYNGDCSKSRAAKAFLDAHNIQYSLINYLETPLTIEEIDRLLAMLGIGIDGLVRTKEDDFKRIALEWFTWSPTQKKEFVIQNPIVIERPIVIYNHYAVIARPDTVPIEKLLKLAGV